MAAIKDARRYRNIKFEIRSTNYETISKFEFSKQHY